MRSAQRRQAAIACTTLNDVGVIVELVVLSYVSSGWFFPSRHTRVLVAPSGCSSVGAFLVRTMMVRMMCPPHFFTSSYENPLSSGPASKAFVARLLISFSSAPPGPTKSGIDAACFAVMVWRPRFSSSGMP